MRPVLLPWPSNNLTTAVQGGSPIAELNAARATLGPCVYRALHTHYAADELLIVVSGRIEALLLAPNHTVYKRTLEAGQNVVFPKGWNHYLYNPTCNQAHTHIFFNARYIGTINIPLNLAAAGPEYLRATYGRNPPQPQGLWVADSKCLERCQERRNA
ncbi:hypothetical protein HYH03_005667 [Edaphochlamys debaryana]|uniref:Germin-like protein n=1 Tax=Edaphochlamys debaryana TaxID=47281 RepID=A0A835Y5M4_9CHLO|nr:hypothetical protein HYH03_005667 [Edaphochlamys debaryana]|eukprot:KAG2496443.1 hypothetical protein HYH03_005667 [Edaphochlamys debaryana]